MPWPRFKPRSTHLTLLVLAVALVAPLAGADATAARSGLAAAADQQLRCDPQAHRVVNPVVVEDDGLIDVSVEFTYSCPDQARHLLFFLVVETSNSLEPSGRIGRERLANVKESLSNLVGEIDYDNGSQGGLILYSAGSNTRLALQGGNSGRQALLSAIGGLSGGSPSARGAAQAINTGAEALLGADGNEGTVRVLVILDAGAALGDESEVLRACERARDNGISIAVASLEPASGRLKDCAEEVLYKASARSNSEDLPERLTALGYGITHGNKAHLASISDHLASGMAYEPGSGVPDPGFVFGREISWELQPPAPARGHRVLYQVRALGAGTDLAVSESAVAALVYADGSSSEVPLDNPPICVYPTGRPEACADFAPTPTPPEPTMTPEATDEPTQEPDPDPTATSAPDPAATEDPMRHNIFLPVAHSG